jgi:SPP1 family predicted phage head-tail adaptor
MTAMLDTLLTFHRRTDTNTGLGTTTAWADLGRVWAHRVDMAVAESVAAGTIQADRTVNYMVRKNSLTKTVRPADALIDKGVTYQIIGIKDAPRRDLLEITARAAVSL